MMYRYFYPTQMSCIDAAIIKALVEHIGMNPDDVPIGGGGSDTTSSSPLLQPHKPADGNGFVEALGLTRGATNVSWSEIKLDALVSRKSARASDYTSAYNVLDIIRNSKLVVLRYKKSDGAIKEAIYTGRSGETYYFESRYLDGSNTYATIKVVNDESASTLTVTSDYTSIYLNDDNTGFFYIKDDNLNIPLIAMFFMDLIYGRDTFAKLTQ